VAADWSALPVSDAGKSAVLALDGRALDALSLQARKRRGSEAPRVSTEPCKQDGGPSAARSSAAAVPTRMEARQVLLPWLAAPEEQRFEAV
jgi:hypothetical protein